MQNLPPKQTISPEACGFGVLHEHRYNGSAALVRILTSTGRCGLEHYEFDFPTDDGLRLYGQGWQPEAPPKAAMCLVHGLGEHSGRYAYVAQAFAEAGYATLAFDLRGHGKSAGQRGHAPSFKALMMDIDRFLAQVELRFSSAPRFLYGHSLGGILVLNYGLYRKQAAWCGVIATSPGLHTALEQQKTKVALARILGPLLPTVSLASGLDPHDISRDPTVVDTYMHDPLVHDRTTFGMGAALLDAIGYAFAHAAEFSFPLLLVHGTADRIAFPSSSMEFAASQHGDCTLKLWEGLYHETHNEPEKAQVLQYNIEWLDRHLKTKLGEVA